MLEDDVIQEVNEAIPWVSNLVIVPKKSGEFLIPGKTGSRITGSPDQGSRITGSRIKDQLKMN